MKIIMVLDDDNGMMFNQRRQSQDAALRGKIKEMIGDKPLYVNEYSAGQFKDSGIRLFVSEDFLDVANQGDYCFLENTSIRNRKSKTEGFIIFRWNRKYPGDFKPDIMPEECNMTCSMVEEFPGRSHEKITMEIWEVKSDEK